jgi:hypothetical protein
MLPDAAEMSAGRPDSSLSEDGPRPATAPSSQHGPTSPGRARAEAHADAFWWSSAYAAVKMLAAAGTTFSAEHLPMLGVTEPDHPARVGSLFSAACRNGLIEVMGSTIGMDGRPRRVWRGVQR